MPYLASGQIARAIATAPLHDNACPLALNAKAHEVPGLVCIEHAALLEGENTCIHDLSPRSRKSEQRENSI